MEQNNQDQNQIHQHQVYQEPKVSKIAVMKKWYKSAKLATKRYLKECYRVLQVTKKPNKEEFKTIMKVSGLGILLIGFIGFVIHLIRELLF